MEFTLLHVLHKEYIFNILHRFKNILCYFPLCHSLIHVLSCGVHFNHHPPFTDMVRHLISWLLHEKSTSAACPFFHTQLRFHEILVIFVFSLLFSGLHVQGQNVWERTVCVLARFLNREITQGGKTELRECYTHETSVSIKHNSVRLLRCCQTSFWSQLHLFVWVCPHVVCPHVVCPQTQGFNKLRGKTPTAIRSKQNLICC